MTTPIRSANAAYYASKQPLLIRGTKEGRKNPQPNPSYKQKNSDTTAPSAKYYRELGTQPGQPGQPAQQVQAVAANQGGPVKTLTAKPQILPEVVQAFQQGASAIKVEGTSLELNQARTAVELAVGRNTLTREQADRVTFHPVKEAPPEPPKSPIQQMSDAAAKEMNDQEWEKLKTVAEAPTQEEVVEEQIEAATDVAPMTGVPEADAILNPPEEAESKPKRKRKTRSKKKESDEVTEADLASAFGVADTDDDFDSDD